MAFNHKSILSIDVDADTIIAVELVKKRGRVALSGHKTASSLMDIGSAFSGQDRYVAVSIPTQSLLVKSFPAPASLLKSRDTKKDVSSFLARQNLPVRLEECFWHFSFSPGCLNFVAARKDAVERILRTFTEAGIAVSAVIPSYLALSSLAAYLRGDKERCAVLQVRGDSSELVITDNKRVWAYPVPAGRRSSSGGLLLDEIRRIVNMHAMQNASAPPVSALLIGGLPPAGAFGEGLQQLFPGAQLARLEPLKKLSVDRNTAPEDSSGMSAAVGMGLAALGVTHTHPVNLVGEKLRQERAASRVVFAGRIAVTAAVGALVLLAGLNVWEGVRLVGLKSAAGETRTRALAAVPQAKALKAEYDALEQARVVLQRKYDMPGLYLKAFAAVAESAPAKLYLADFDAKAAGSGRGAGLDVFLGGTASEYDAINDFLVKLKARPGLRDVKVVASTLPDAAAGQSIDFKVRFSLE